MCPIRFMWKPVNPENMSTCQHSAHLTHITSGPRRASLMKSSFLPVIFGVPYVGYAFVPPPASPLVGRVVAARQISGMSMSCNKGADNNRSNGNNNSGAIRSRIQGVAVALALSTSIALGAPSGPALAEELPAGQYVDYARKLYAAKVVFRRCVLRCSGAKTTVIVVTLCCENHVLFVYLDMF